MKSHRAILYFLMSLFITLLPSFPSFSNAAFLDDWHWRNPLPQGNDLNDVHFGNGVFVAVGQFGTILTSPDGTAWTVRASGTTKTLHGVAFGNGVFVAVGESGTILTSPDGIAWTARASGITDPHIPLFGVTFGGGTLVSALTSGATFVAVGDEGTILTSSDGIAWKTQISGTKSTLFDVLFGNNVYVARGCGILISSDGETWTKVPVTVDPYYGPWCYTAIDFCNGKFVAGVALGPVSFWLPVLQRGSRTSVDGINWIGEGSRHEFDAMTFGNGLYVGSKGDVFKTSSNGLTWEPSTDSPPVSFSFRAITYGNGVFAAVGEDGRIKTSPDGKIWTARTVRTSDYLSGVTFGNGTFVAVGDGIVTSPDGITWIRRGADIPPLYGVVFGNGTFVAVGAPQILTSPDGVTWTPRAVETGGTGIEGIAFGNGMFVGVGDTIVASPDGVTWTIGTTSGTRAFLRAVTFGNNTFVAAGNGIRTSTDGMTWSPAISVGISLYGVAFGNGVFVAVGESGAILTSLDGVNWTPQDAGLPPYVYLLGVTFDGGLFVVTGGNGTVLTSADGVTWAHRASGTFHSLTGASFGNGTFVVVGVAGTILQSGRAISPDIRANNSDGPVITLHTGDVLSVTASIDAGIGSGISADWWVVADTSFGGFYYLRGQWYLFSDWKDLLPSYQGPLIHLPPLEVLNMSWLPAGRYVFYFGIDTNMNGLLDYDSLYYDYLIVNIE